MQTSTQRYRGGCHCGSVAFEFTAPVIKQATACNCSMCSRYGFLHVFVAHQDFTLLTATSVLTEYRFNTGAAQHLFCSQCGVKSYYQPRSHPKCWSVNARCISQLDIDALDIKHFDGLNWSLANAQLLD